MTGQPDESQPEESQSGDGQPEDILLNGEFPLKHHLGMTIEVDAPGQATGSLTATDDHMNPNGVVHGAVIFALVDTAMGGATMSKLSGRFCASVEIQTRFIRPAGHGPIVARASVTKMGKSLAHLSAEVRNSDDDLVATATGTFALLVPGS